MVKKELPNLIRFTLLVLLLVAARFADTYIGKAGSGSYNLETGAVKPVSEKAAVVQATR